MIERFEGIPYRHGGYDFDGTFCWGLIHLYYKEELNIELPRYDKDVADYKNIGDASARFEQDCRGEDWKETTNPKPGDVVLIRRGNKIGHCGVVIAPREMLHIQDDYLSCVARLDNPIWQRRIYGYYRHRLRI